MVQRAPKARALTKRQLEEKHRAEMQELKDLMRQTIAGTQVIPPSQQLVPPQQSPSQVSPSTQFLPRVAQYQQPATQLQFQQPARPDFPGQTPQNPVLRPLLPMAPSPQQQQDQWCLPQQPPPPSQRRL